MATLISDTRLLLQQKNDLFLPKTQTKRAWGKAIYI